MTKRAVQAQKARQTDHMSGLPPHTQPPFQPVPGIEAGVSPSSLEYSPVPTVKLSYKDFSIVVEDTCADNLSAVLTQIVSTYKLLQDVSPQQA